MQEKIQYDPEVAKEVAALYNLAASVIRVWKVRGFIPAKYFQEGGFDTSAKVADRDPVAQKIVDILGLPEIAASKWRSLGQKGSDVVRGKSTLTEAEVADMVAEVTEVRNKFRRAIDVPTTKNILAALQDVRVKPTKIVERRVYTLLRNAHSELDKNEKERVKIALAAFNAVLKI